ncbi:hypothetical protein CLAFUW4_02845 [Fulvia fulva]|uniref:Uncharacterized protein n=1 Tax=Passalora fulva TaxID=5499 RepID=A0A9Q8L9P6_PASFU|nr:uncharacterized protein CLAFUR5_02832 [Fulvia fulva]KAK4633230.1 hypothetical protein CLAFUR0_02841 [Fulvia fulva]UJO13346.1 hypothetical protein CLAFUR5_02832 [Fulvia fulva]WPV10854.1 hypothetical protein CLAFUW4_02845 [Fulvia fulva]
MDASEEKVALERGTMWQQETTHSTGEDMLQQEATDADIRVSMPPEDSQRNTLVADDEKDVIEKETGTDTTAAGTPDPKHLSVDFDTEGRRKRESVESRLSSVLRDSSVLSESDFGELDEQIRQARLRQEQERPQNSRGQTSASGVSTRSQRSGRSMPPLRRKETKLAQKEAHPWQHLGITLGLPMIVLFDIVVPIIIYYAWYNSRVSDWKKECRQQHPDQDPCPIPKPEYDKHILGYAIISFGFGELWILVARMWRLVREREICAPLLSRNVWELDATSWVYGVAMLMALIPFVIGAELELQHLYLYAPTFIMGFLGMLMIVTTFFPFTLPIGINSQARGTKLRPFIYYAAEDFVAVDGLQDREFRVRFNERYETNKMFRRFFLYLTLWWLLGVFVYIGCVSAVIWTLDFHYAFGLSLGVLFSYITIWASVTAVWVNVEMKREHTAYENGEIEA